MSRDPCRTRAIIRSAWTHGRSRAASVVQLGQGFGIDVPGKPAGPAPSQIGGRILERIENRECRESRLSCARPLSRRYDISHPSRPAAAIATKRSPVPRPPRPGRVIGQDAEHLGGLVGHLPLRGRVPVARIRRAACIRVKSFSSSARTESPGWRGAGGEENQRADRSGRADGLAAVEGWTSEASRIRMPRTHPEGTPRRGDRQGLAQGVLCRRDGLAGANRGPRGDGPRAAGDDRPDGSQPLVRASVLGERAGRRDAVPRDLR